MAKGNNLSVNPAATAVAYSEDAGSEQRSAEEIRQNIAATRESITDTVDRLSDRFQETFDWRTYVGKYPVVAVGVVAGLGFLAAGIFKPRSTPVERVKTALADCFEDFTDSVRSQIGSITPRRPGLRQTITAAATGLAVKTATEYLRNQVLVDRQSRLTEGEEEQIKTAGRE